MAPRVKQEYVVGFLFGYDVDSIEKAKNVVLIKKDKPDFLKGKWNGVGGKVELGEEPKQAMCREFLEETGCYIDNWHYQKTKLIKDVAIHFYFAFGNHRVKTKERERVARICLNKLQGMKNVLTDVHEFINSIVTDEQIRCR